ncbi:MAG TPA: SDR family oxidoreductase [Candidatus Limnocylindrales bacterium]|nr:SDR family oxidoreductase [Candidatus Limnocylindrales bacterium]
MADDRRIGETVLITGASTGIGREIAKEFASRGYNLVLVARNEARLQVLARELATEFPITARVIPADLATADGPSRVFRAVSGQGIAIDILVNNAGIMHYSPFVEQGTEKSLEIVRLNVLALTAMTNLFLQPMVARGRGRVLNVASVAAFQPTPLIAVYGATKAYVLSLTEALSAELSGTGVTITALCPGFTSTEMLDKFADEAGDNVIPEFLKLDAAAVAREGVDACLEGTTIQVNGLTYKFLLMLESWQPRWVIRTVGGIVSRAFRPAP